MRILVIGGTGLIGSSIVRDLAGRGDEVTVLSRGRRPMMLPDGVGRMEADRSDVRSFEAAIAASGIWDAVIDMICFEPDEAMSAIRALSGRTAQYLMTSTVDVYRKPATRLPYREGEPFGGIGHYAIAKVRCEDILWRAHARGAIALTVIRPGATYGETGHIVSPLGFRPSFVDRLRKGKPVIVHGDGSSLLALCHRDDVAAAFVAATGKPECLGQAYHVTGEEWVTWDQHVTMVARTSGAPSPTLVHIPSEALARLAPEAGRLALENFRFNGIYDNTAARRDLGFEYRISLEEGFRRTIAWLDKHGGIADSDEDPLDDRIIVSWRSVVDRAAKEYAGLQTQTDPSPGPR
jgi:nucleoside-diphosphate-sugar epimerase